MKPEKRKYKCNGCGEDRPCYVETNQEPSAITDVIEDLKCILDETNQTSYFWVEIYNTDKEIKTYKKALQDIVDVNGCTGEDSYVMRDYAKEALSVFNT